MKKICMVSTRVDNDTRSKLDEICKQLDRPQSWVISTLIQRADVPQLEALSQGNHLSPKSEIDPALLPSAP